MIISMDLGRKKGCSTLLLSVCMHNITFSKHTFDEALLLNSTRGTKSWFLLLWSKVIHSRQVITITPTIPSNHFQKEHELLLFETIYAISPSFEKQW